MRAEKRAPSLECESFISPHLVYRKNGADIKRQQQRNAQLSPVLTRAPGCIVLIAARRLLAARPTLVVRLCGELRELCVSHSHSGAHIIGGVVDVMHRTGPTALRLVANPSTYDAKVQIRNDHIGDILSLMHVRAIGTTLCGVNGDLMGENDPSSGCRPPALDGCSPPAPPLANL